MDWLCPPFHVRLHELLERYHGEITAEIAVRYITPGTNSGNLMVAVYDLTHNQTYFAFGHQNPDGKKVDAYLRPFIKLDLNELFSHKLSV